MPYKALLDLNNVCVPPILSDTQWSTICALEWLFALTSRTIKNYAKNHAREPKKRRVWSFLQVKRGAF